MSYNIIKHAGEVKQVTLENGTVIQRQEALFVDAWGMMVKCAPYDNHFIYRNPDTSEGSSTFLCTCGNPAVVIPPSPTGLFVCLFDYNTGMKGLHATSLYNLKDWDKVKGQTLDTNKIRGGAYLMPFSDLAKLNPIGGLRGRKWESRRGGIGRPVKRATIWGGLPSVLTGHKGLGRALGFSQTIPARVIPVTAWGYYRPHERTDSNKLISFSFRGLYHRC